MSKRCCAASCYNSVATNRSVEYFGFPKSLEFATAWAKAAGREDLLQKSLNNIIKYFLCSEHFANECFEDPPNNRKLKKKSRPVVVPIPTIFHNNFEECVSNLLKEERCSQTIEEQLDYNSDCLPQDINGIERLADCDIAMGLVEPVLLGTVDDFIITESNQIAHTEIIPEVTKHESENDENNSTLGNLSARETLDHNEHVEPINCRLCLSVEENEPFIPIFQEGSEISYILYKILPDMIKPNDGFPQQICLLCHRNAIVSYNTIELFKAVQEKLKIM
ncbi:uncharacterized protein LOC129771631 [Toxorhynchites rutilus septentrionalis]|uniref:uncharacterized protein LOC129771631 n=1 Tax=Toxorhynchites rutilus septentrionalis TaxID=329112 RepID=UPI00247AB003|nr:uncharacterized protein LOC129771631 [Toxorhynchites rutilus septentrionalis]XP_055631471.1 uncharacterized protein LOC129771631 [Toxorhynchites rutilus septentrionalis]XP_055631479.1 uncharacterized protein LOC129771631 [Toxorhynchites rutilus septentrionalis]